MGSRRKFAFILTAVFSFLLIQARAEKRAAVDPIAAGEASYDSGKYDDARKKLEAALKAKLDPAVERRALHLLALSCFGLGDTRRAIDYWENLFEDKSSDDLAVKVSYNLGLAYTRLGQTQKAYDSLTRLDDALLRKQSQPLQKAFDELLGQTATALDQNEKAVLAFSSGLNSTKDANARKALLDQIAAAAQKLKSAESLDSLANQVKDAEAKKRILEAKKSAKKEPKAAVANTSDWNLIPELALAHLDYRQTAVDTLKITTISPGLVGKYRFASDWAVVGGGNIFGIILKTEGNDTFTRLLQLWGGVEYQLYRGGSWKIDTDLVYTYGSLLTPQNKYGFRDLAGPQLGFRFFYGTGGKDGLNLTFTAAILNNDRSKLTTDSRRLAATLGYQFEYADGMPPLDVGIRYTDVNLKFASSEAHGKIYELTISSDFEL